MTPPGFVHYAGGGKPGLRLAVKDNIDVAGMPCAAGLQAWRGRVAQRDAPCVAKLRAAGYTVVGKTLMDEAAFGALGDNPWFGRCHNPVRQGYTAGGSSSGSAAVVAAGLCDAALGTDTLGSVRIPASYCGVVGYVPGRGRIDMTGVMPLMPEFDRLGVLAPSVASAARIAAAMAGDPGGFPSSGPSSIGVVRDIEDLVAPAIAAAARNAAAVLARAGHRVVELSGRSLDWRGLRRSAFLLIEVEAARVLAALLDNLDSGISPDLRSALAYGRAASSERVARAREAVLAARQALARWLAGCELLLLPTTPQAAFAFDAPIPDSQADFTAPASVAGLAAISVPAGRSEHLPLGVQLFGPDEGRLLGAASVLA